MQGIVLPAVMPDSFESLEGSVALFDTHVPWVQLDIMDGVFVPAISWPFIEVDSGPPFAEGFGGAQQQTADSVRLPTTKELAYEVHLMVQDPCDIGNAFIAAGAKRVIAHIESFGDTVDSINEVNSEQFTVDSTKRARECFAQWKKRGAQVGVSLLLETPLEAVYPLIESKDVSVVQVMSITPIGVQGSVFDERAVERVHTLKERYPNLVIAVDGGVSAQTLPDLAHAGATHFGVGSAIVKADDPIAAYRTLVHTVEHI